MSVQAGSAGTIGITTYHNPKAQTQRGGQEAAAVLDPEVLQAWQPVRDQVDTDQTRAQQAGYDVVSPGILMDMATGRGRVGAQVTHRYCW